MSSSFFLALNSSCLVFPINKREYKKLSLVLDSGILPHLLSHSCAGKSNVVRLILSFAATMMSGV
jgi:ABC-type ATPase involved in cell division